MTEYLSEVLTKTEVEMANKRVADFYPLKNLTFLHLFPSVNEYQTKAKEVKI